MGIYSFCSNWSEPAAVTVIEPEWGRGEKRLIEFEKRKVKKEFKAQFRGLLDSLGIEWHERQTGNHEPKVGSLGPVAIASSR